VPRPPRSWHGLVATILAIGVATTVILVVIIRTSVNPDEATLEATVLGAIVGTLATYLGAYRGGASDRDTSGTSTPDTGAGSGTIPPGDDTGSSG
jgi:hypothetical protein